MLDQFQAQYADLGLHAQCHPVVPAGLEFEHDIDVHELIPNLHAPDDAVRARQRRLARIRRIDPFEGRQRHAVEHGKGVKPVSSSRTSSACEKSKRYPRS